MEDTAYVFSLLPSIHIASALNKLDDSQGVIVREWHADSGLQTFQKSDDTAQATATSGADGKGDAAARQVSDVSTWALCGGMEKVMNVKHHMRREIPHQVKKADHLRTPLNG
jgi:hypothetical protein